MYKRWSVKFRTQTKQFEGTYHQQQSNTSLSLWRTEHLVHRGPKCTLTANKKLIDRHVWKKEDLRQLLLSEEVEFWKKRRRNGVPTILHIYNIQYPGWQCLCCRVYELNSETFKTVQFPQFCRMSTVPQRFLSRVSSSLTHTLFYVQCRQYS